MEYWILFDVTFFVKIFRSRSGMKKGGKFLSLGLLEKLNMSVKKKKKMKPVDIPIDWGSA